jgi:hypothetical protein
LRTEVKNTLDEQTELANIPGTKKKTNMPSGKNVRPKDWEMKTDHAEAEMQT